MSIGSCTSCPPTPAQSAANQKPNANNDPTKIADELAKQKAQVTFQPDPTKIVDIQV